MSDDREPALMPPAAARSSSCFVGTAAAALLISFAAGASAQTPSQDRPISLYAVVPADPTGVEGVSENIRVRSIVGRFLEHSRIYSFEAGDRVATYIGSPDLMQRNLDHRIEVLMPVENARVRQEVHAVLDSALEDDTNAWSLGADGEWTRVAPGGPSPAVNVA